MLPKIVGCCIVVTSLSWKQHPSDNSDFGLQKDDDF